MQQWERPIHSRTDFQTDRDKSSEEENNMRYYEIADLNEYIPPNTEAANLSYHDERTWSDDEIDDAAPHLITRVDAKKSKLVTLL